jgi:predicted dienelactone hydrolase
MCRDRESIGGELMNSHSPVFVSLISHSYSGSTLLAILLGAHPEIATVDERTRSGSVTYLELNLMNDGKENSIRNS